MTMVYSTASTPTLVPSSPVVSTSQKAQHRTKNGSKVLCGHCGSAGCHHCRAAKKTVKEQINRSELQKTLQHMQDSLVCYGGLETIGSTLGASNADISGLIWNKHDVSIRFIAFANYSFDDALKKAMEAGREEEFYDQMREYNQRFLETGDPVAGTFLETDGVQCERGAGTDKKCRVHGNDPWTRCRHGRVLDSFRRKKAEFAERLRRLLLCSRD
jgi:hypothetical protein